MGICSSEKKPILQKQQIATSNPVKSPTPQINQEVFNVLEPSPSVCIKLDGKVVSSPINYEKSARLRECLNKIFTISQVFEDLPKNIDCYFIILNNSSILNKIDDTLETIIKDYNNGKTDLIIDISFGGLEVASNFHESQFKRKYIGKLIEDECTLLVFDVKQNRLDNYVFPEEDIKSNRELLHTFSYFSAYCNAIDIVYISGGEYQINKEKKKHNTFFSIDCRTKEINKLTDLKTPRFWHSMIYIPEKYIFIVGGGSEKSVEVYDIKTQIISQEPDMNEIRCETSLCLVDNIYLYALSGYEDKQQIYHDSIERLNLLNAQRKWEIVLYKLDNCESLDTRFFGIISKYDRTLLIVGGIDITKNPENNQKEHNYQLDLNTNLITAFESLGKNDCFFGEKTFMPIEEGTYAIIPLSDTPKVLIFSSGVFRIIHLDNEITTNDQFDRIVSSKSFYSQSNNNNINNNLPSVKEENNDNK